MSIRKIKPTFVVCTLQGSPLLFFALKYLRFSYLSMCLCGLVVGAILFICARIHIPISNLYH